MLLTTSRMKKGQETPTPPPIPGAIAQAHAAYLAAEQEERDARAVFLPKHQRLTALQHSTPSALGASPSTAETIATLAEAHVQRQQALTLLQAEVPMLEALVEAKQRATLAARQTWLDLQSEAETLRQRLPGFEQGRARAQAEEHQAEDQAARLIQAARERRQDWERRIEAAEARIAVLAGTNQNT